MKRARSCVVIGVVLLLAALTVLAYGASPDKGINLVREFVIQGKKLVVSVATPGRVEITVDGKLRYGGGPGMPTETHGGYQSRRSAGAEGVCVAVEFAEVIDLKDHSVLVFETWYKRKEGLVGRVWLESVWPSDEKAVVDGYVLDHDGTYHACVESLPAGADPAKAPTALKTLAKTGDTEFQYHCGGWGNYPARTAVYKRVLHYDLVEPPIPER